MSLEEYLVPITSKANICLDCAYPILKCLWLHKGKPVDGWAAVPVLLHVYTSHGKKLVVETYRITGCPLYVPYPKERYKQDDTDRRNTARTFY